MKQEEKLKEIIRSCEWLLDKSELLSFEKSLSEPPSVSIRINSFKESHQFRTNEQVPWCSQGYYLGKRPVFTLDPFFHAGCYYVQEASSMFLQHILENILPRKTMWRALDLCAAPGGKSTLTSSLLPQNSFLVSNEVISSRARILQENTQKWGLSNNVITSLNTSVFGNNLKNYFDLIIVDAPCSGEGLIRKDPDAITEWNTSNISNCIVRQKNILQDAWNTLAPGGFLIYSTCTYNKKENEDQVEFLIREFHAVPIDISFPDEWNIVVTETLGCRSFRFFPDRIRGEGFFITVLRKPEELNKPVHHLKNRKLIPEPVAKKEIPELEKFIRNDQKFIFSKTDNLYYFHPEETFKEIQYLGQQIPLLQPGNLLAIRKGKDMIPSPSLALSVALNRETFNSIEVDQHTSLLFLKKEEIRTDAQDGWNLVCHRNIPLGWIKKIGSRINNYFPKEWRIRMSLD